MPDYRDNFKDVNENNSESLFEIQFTEGLELILTGPVIQQLHGNR